MKYCNDAYGKKMSSNISSVTFGASFSKEYGDHVV
jgi:hypothetical protein